MTTRRLPLFAGLVWLAWAIGLAGVARADDAAPAPPTAAEPAPPVVTAVPPAPEPAAAPAPPAEEPVDTALHFAGSLQLDYLSVPTSAHPRETTLDGSTVELSLKMTKEFSRSASATVKVCFACHGFEAGMAFVELRAADLLRVRVGRMTPAFGSFPLRHDPANHLTSDKPLPYDMGRMLRRVEWNEGILPAPWVDNGVEVSGTHFWHDGRADYAVYAVSGPKADRGAADFDFLLSRTPGSYYVDNNSQPTLGARASTALDLSETTILTLGASGMVGTYDPDRALGFAIGGADAALQLGRASLRAEYLLRATQMALGDNPATRFRYGPGPDGQFSDYFVKDGFYVEGEVPFGAVSVIARWDGLRRRGNVLTTDALSDRSSVLRYTLGAAVRFAHGIQLKGSAELYRFSDFGTDVAAHVGLAAAF